MPTLIIYCKNCGEPICQPWDGKDKPGFNGWRHLIYEAMVVYYYCDHSEQTHAEPPEKSKGQQSGEDTGL